MSSANDTIFALATAPGRAGVAIVRISGPQATHALQTLGISQPEPRMATLCKLVHSGEIIDEALVLWFPAPHSFTGEDVAELHIHGSRAVWEEIIRALSSLIDVRLAEPGEFSKRAFLNGKMDLTEAEGLADLIEAETRAQKNQALRQLQGELGALYENFRKRVLTLLAHLEAYIDFPDEDIPASVTQEINQGAESLLRDIAQHLGDNRQGEKLREGLYAAIIGPPNAGKSSLMNWLAGREVAIVSSKAGTTRDVIEVHLDIGGYPLILADTAGLREGLDDIEEEGIRRAHLRAKEADIKIALFDATALPHIDMATQNLIDENTIIFINKQDAVTPPLPHSIGGQAALPISVKTEAGLIGFMAKLQETIGKAFTPSSSAVITRARYRKALESAASHMQAFLRGGPIELACEELRLAALDIGKLTGRINVDDVLDEIFRKFCIGK